MTQWRRGGSPPPLPPYKVLVVGSLLYILLGLWISTDQKVVEELLQCNNNLKDVVGDN